MVNEIKKQVRLVEGALKKNAKGYDWKALLQLHRVRIGFFQHERLIHLLITLFFGFVFLLLVLVNLAVTVPGMFLLAPILLALTLAYVWHYFELENGVQKLYRLDEEIQKKSAIPTQC